MNAEMVFERRFLLLGEELRAFLLWRTLPFDLDFVLFLGHDARILERNVRKACRKPLDSTLTQNELLRLGPNGSHGRGRKPDEI